MKTNKLNKEHDPKLLTHDSSMPYPFTIIHGLKKINLTKAEAEKLCSLLRKSLYGERND